MDRKGVRQYLVWVVFVVTFIILGRFSFPASAISGDEQDADRVVTTELAVKVLETRPRLLKIADQTKRTWGVLAQSGEQAKTKYIAKKEAAEAARRAAEKARREREERLSKKYKNVDQVISTWLGSYAHGNVGFEIYDVNAGTILASHNAHQSMRARSLYKLFYLYDAYAEIDAGRDDTNAEYAGMTLGTCLDVMVRYSNNPCAEAMYNDKARSKRVAQLISRLGLGNTASDGLRTSAHDMVKLLLHFYKHPEWSRTSWSKFRNSAISQPYTYRRGIPSGFRKASVYNKTGFGGAERNDAAMVEFPNGKKYIIVLMTTNTSYAAITDLAKMLENTLI